MTSNRAAAQLGFDFDVSASASASAPVSSPETAPTPLSSPAAPQAPQLHARGDDPRHRDERSNPEDRRPARGRAALRARTAVLFSRLAEMGLRNVDALVLMRTRTVMVSLIGRTLRVNEGYAEAPEVVLRAIVQFATARSRSARSTAKDVILSYEVERAPAAKRPERARAGVRRCLHEHGTAEH